MRANYYGSLNNSSWLTHVATIGVTKALNIRFLRVPRLFLRGAGEIRRPVRRAAAALWMIAWLRSVAMAGPEGSGASPPDPAATATAPSPATGSSPWIDL